MGFMPAAYDFFWGGNLIIIAGALPPAPEPNSPAKLRPRTRHHCHEAPAMGHALGRLLLGRGRRCCCCCIGAGKRQRSRGGASTMRRAVAAWRGSAVLLIGTIGVLNAAALDLIGKRARGGRWRAAAGRQRAGDGRPPDAARSERGRPADSPAGRPQLQRPHQGAEICVACGEARPAVTALRGRARCAALNARPELQARGLPLWSLQGASVTV